MKIIEVKNFSFRYANGDRDSLENVTLDVEEGTFNVLCGKSGCGKSTLPRRAKIRSGPLWRANLDGSAIMVRI
ncbi:ATP-binding cassette domain-containing protein [Blautia wexlerae]|nr:ATP-binding cassette domain-containing protein [Blautia wexlerae]